MRERISLRQEELTPLPCVINVDHHRSMFLVHAFRLRTFEVDSNLTFYSQVLAQCLTFSKVLHTHLTCELTFEPNVFVLAKRLVLAHLEGHGFCRSMAWRGQWDWRM